jgi:hypothetical protein
MSDSKLGGLPDLSQDTPVLQPAPVVSFDNVTEAFNRLAQSAGDIANTEFSKQSTEEGQQAVTRDASGNLQYAPPSTLSQITGTTAAYTHAAQLRYLSESQLDIRPKIIDLQAQHPDDPVGFKSALDQYTGAVLNNTPESFQPAVRSMIEQSGSDALDTLTRSKNASAVEAAKNAGLNLWTQNTYQLSGYYRSGQQNTPQAQALLKQNTDIESSLKNNPAISLTRDELLKFDTLQSTLTGEAISGQATSLYQKYGEADAESRLTGLINNPDLKLSGDERQHYLGEGLSQIRMLHALATQNQQEAQRQVEYQVDDARAKALATGDYSSVMSDAQVRDAYAKNPARANQILEILHGATQTYSMMQQVKLASPADLQALKKKYDPANAATPSPARTMPVEQAIYGEESTFGANAKPSIDGSSFGPMQVTPDTFKRFAKPGESIDNPQDNVAVGKRYIDYLSKLPNVKGDPARIAVGYFSGEGNIAPLGSPTPYLHDTHDANQKYVSSYVSDVTGRMGLQSDFAARSRTYQAFTEAEKQRQAQIDKDSAAYVLNNAPAIQLQIASNDPATRGAGVRALLATQSHLGVPNNKLRVFTDAQADNLSGRLFAGSPDDAVNLMRATTAGLTTPQLQIAARQIAPKNRAFATAVSAAQSDPTLAASLIIGERYKMENPDVLSQSQRASNSFDTATQGLFESAPDARAGAYAAVNALYARNMIGKPHDFDESTYGDAMKQVIGEPMTVRGQTIVPPRPGMEASDVENMLSGLKDFDIARYGNGTPLYAHAKRVPVTDIAEHGIPVYTGAPGIYRVKMPGQGYLGVAGLSGGKTFLLNLGAKANGATPPIPVQP